MTSTSTNEVVSQYKFLIPQSQAVAGAEESEALPTSLGQFSGSLVDNGIQSPNISVTRSHHIVAPPSQLMCWSSPSRSNDTSSPSHISASITSPLVHSKGRVVKSVAFNEHSIGGGVIDGMFVVVIHV
jgi:hypothetical protein